MTLVSESHVRFEGLAPEYVKKAVEIARRPTLPEAQAGKLIGVTAPIRAKYKIEVTFIRNRRPSGRNACAIRMWESGKHLHGGGDELMFWCRDARSGHEDGCWGPISGDAIKGGVACCPTCKMAINAQYLTDVRGWGTGSDPESGLSARDLADQVCRIFQSLKGDSDIYLKFHKEDVRYIAMQRALGAKKANDLKGMHIYTLERILKDLSAGASLSERIRAFLVS